MSGRSPGTPPHAIRTGSSLGREAATDPRWFTRCAAALVVTAVAAIAWSLLPLAGHSARAPEAHRHLPYPRLAFPVEISGSQYIPLKWTDIPGWIDDDHLAAYQAFRSSCKPIAAQHALPARSSSSNINAPGFKPLGISLREPCRAARAAEMSDEARARAFFEEHFTPLQISRLGEGDGFVTGYYEPILEGSRTQSDTYDVPVYPRPSNLFVRGFKQSSPDLPNKGQVFRKIGRRKLVPYYDRAQIE